MESRWRLRDGVTLATGAEGTLFLAADERPGVELQMPHRRVARALARLREGASESELATAAGEDVHSAALALHFLRELRERGLLVADILHEGRRMATLVPRTRSFEIGLPDGEDGAAWQLSRFAWLRREGTHLLLECAGASCVVRIHGADLAAWLHEAIAPTVPEAGSARARVLALLGGLGFLVDPSAPEDPAEQTWEFHDRAFHERTRNHGDLESRGGTYRFDGRLPPEPAVRPAHAGETEALSPPLARARRSLADVVQARSSRRSMGERRVTRDQVAALLYRVARTGNTISSPPQDCLSRPYPSAGAIHELEFYVAVGACEGLSPGFYHYRGEAHVLTRLEGGDSPAQGMLADCAHAWGQPGKAPQCLIVLSSRLPRLAWKYERIAYRLTLLDAGVVLANLYLVCTDLGLAGCAAGTGRPDLFAAATGTSSWEETSIAEFGFGSSR